MFKDSSKKKNTRKRYLDYKPPKYLSAKDEFMLRGLRWRYRLCRGLHQQNGVMYRVLKDFNEIWIDSGLTMAEKIECYYMALVDVCFLEMTTPLTDQQKIEIRNHMSEALAETFPITRFKCKDTY